MLENHKNFGNESFAVFMPRMRTPEFLYPEHYPYENITKEISSYTSFLEEDINTVRLGWALSLNKYFLFEPMEKFILECHQHGLVIQVENQVRRKRAEKSTQKPKKVLTMHMLSAGWYIWLGGICVATVAFFSEHVVRYNSKKRRIAREKLKKLKIKRNMTCFDI